MSYYVYENWRAEGRKAVLHVNSCGFCKDGQGLAGGTRSDNGKWHGPFDNVEQAREIVPGIMPVVHRCVQ